MNRRRAFVALAAVASALVVLLGGLGLVVASRYGSGDVSTSGTADTAVGARYGAPEPADAASVAPSNDAAGTGGAVAERDVVRTARLGVTTDDPAAAGDRAAAIADAAGGRVDSDVRDDGATLTLRVPAERLDATLAQLAALGDETSREVTGDDVTAQTADLGARVEALQTSVDRLRTLLADSGSLADLLAVETQLTDRQAELESLQAQQRALADQVSLASVTVSLVAPSAVAATGGPTGFVGALAAGWDGFTTAVRYLLAAFGYTLPFLVVVALLVVVAVRVRRQRARRRPVDLPDPPDATVATG